MLSRLWRQFIDSQRALCRAFDKLLPRKMRLDGLLYFRTGFVDPYLKASAVVWDIGGGKSPYINAERKKGLNLKLVGLDIDKAELAAAPPGLYDATVCADITHYRGKGDADLVICQAVLEHVRNSEAALAAIHSILAPGGIALLFMPSRNAVYARLNRIVPPAMKRKVLSAFMPGIMLDHQGFPAYYDRCTPKEFRDMAQRIRFEVIEAHVYFASNYFMFLLPLYAVWRLWQLVFWGVAGIQAAETFVLALRKKT
jgi:SAM-dependent methyltransferase